MNHLKVISLAVGVVLLPFFVVDEDLTMLESERGFPSDLGDARSLDDGPYGHYIGG